MFNKQKFCHVASNNRNEQKIGVFVYKTTDDLATVTTSGYFNEKIIDINLHDLIIHEKYDAVDRTKVERNLLCVTERTLDNVGTTVIKSKWEGDIETTVNQLVQEAETYVKTDGSRIMTAPLKFASGSMRGAVGPYLNGLSFWKMDSQYTATNIANLTDSRFLPVTTNSIDLGRTANTWKDLYLGGKAYVATLNNGADLTVPNKSGTLATMGDVELAARSGRMLTDQGVWYAKMYSATVPPAAENGTNYADFSQVDGDSNPIIVIYERQSGAWVQTDTITPPADYDGYVPITSKIWDIAEQTGQQGGRILWNHVSKEFTPYPTIISFEDIEVTGDSTVIMPQNPTGSSIVNKDYVDNHIPTGNFYHPDLFDWKWADHQVNDVQWLRADTFSWQSGSVYQAAFNELFYDIQISTYWYGGGGPAYTKSRTPAAGDAVYLNSDLTTQIGTVDSYDDVNDEITVSGDTYSYMSNTYVTPTTETVAGYSLSVYTGHSGRKIVSVSDETNVSNIYTATGVAWYYIIDIPNKRFKLPRKHSTQIVRSGTTSNGAWYRLYADGWVEQGNNVSTASTSVVYPIEMADTSYTLTDVGFVISSSGEQTVTKTTTGFSTSYASHSSGTSGWLVSGWSALDMSAFQCGEKYLYFYVGEFTQTAIENTAGLNAELFNDKVDVGHEVIAFQAPTAGNNYTWYRKYADGWVEQGGSVSTHNDTTVTINLPITMSDANYCVNKCNITANSTTLQNISARTFAVSNRTITSFDTFANSIVDGGFTWQVSGMAA